MPATRACLAAAFLLCSPLAQAQPAVQTPNKPRPTLTTPPAAVEFSDSVVRLESVGLTVQLPAGCVAQRTTYASKEITQIVPPDQTWFINIGAPRTTNSRITVAEVADEAQKQLLAASGVLKDPEQVDREVAETRAKVLERSPARGSTLSVKSGDREFPMQRLYVLSPGRRTSKDIQPNAVRGYTVIQTAPQQFVTFDLYTVEEDFARVKPIYELMIGSARFANPEDLDTKRGAAVEAMTRLFDKLGDADYREILTTLPGGKPGDSAERWLRFYRPAPGGAPGDAEELGYTRVRTRLGQRGELDPSTPKAKWGPALRQEGYIVQMDTRVMMDKNRVDTAAVFFMSPDRAQEAWTARTAIRDAKGAKPALATEIGARDGLNMSVHISASGRADTDIQPRIQREAYLSQVDMLLLPRLLMRSKIAAEYGAYCWRSHDQKVVLRRDSLEQLTDKPGVWKLTTYTGEDSRPQVSLYKENGELIRTEMPDGTVREPIDFDDLVRLWKSKNLPMD